MAKYVSVRKIVSLPEIVLYEIPRGDAEKTLKILNLKKQCFVLGSATQL